MDDEATQLRGGEGNGGGGGTSRAANEGGGGGCRTGRQQKQEGWGIGGRSVWVFYFLVCPSPAPSISELSFCGYFWVAGLSTPMTRSCVLSSRPSSCRRYGSRGLVWDEELPQSGGGLASPSCIPNLGPSPFPSSPTRRGGGVDPHWGRIPTLGPFLPNHEVGGCGDSGPSAHRSPHSPRRPPAVLQPSPAFRPKKALSSHNTVRFASNARCFFCYSLGFAFPHQDISLVWDPFLFESV